MFLTPTLVKPVILKCSKLDKYSTLKEILGLSVNSSIAPTMDGYLPVFTFSMKTWGRSWILYSFELYVLQKLQCLRSLDE